MKFDSNIILNSASNLNTGKKILKDAKKSIKDFEIPNDFRYKNELKSYIDNMQSIAKDLDSLTTWIQDKVEKFNNVKNNGINSAVMSSLNLIGANINSNIYRIPIEEKIKKRMAYLGIPGYTYEDLYNMDEWKEREKVLSEYYLKTPYLGTIDNKEYNTKLIFDWEKGYVPQGSTYLDEEDRFIAVCFTKEKKTGKEQEGVMVVVDTETGKVKWRESYKGHANDVTSIKEDKKLIIPDHKDGLHGEWNIYNYSIEEDDFNLEYDHTIKEINSDALDYDEKRKEITILNGEKGFVYGKEILNENLSPNERKPLRSFWVPDEVRDYEHDEYYMTRGGITVDNGIMIMPYGGFKTTESRAHGQEIGNLYVMYNTMTGRVIGHYKDNITQESEGVNYMKDGSTSVTMNYGKRVIVYSSEDEKYNKEYIVENYNNKTDTQETTQ